MRISHTWFAITLLPAAAWLGLAPQAPAPSIGVAYVSAQRIGTDTVEGRAGVARVNNLQRERSDDLRQKQQVLDATRSQLRLAQADAREKLQVQERQQRTELERAAARAQADIQAIQRQVNADLLAKVKATVAELAPARNIQVVLNSEAALVWAAPSLDLTDSVVAKMNSAAPAK